MKPAWQEDKWQRCGMHEIQTRNKKHVRLDKCDENSHEMRLTKIFHLRKLSDEMCKSHRHQKGDKDENNELKVLFWVNFLQKECPIIVPTICLKGISFMLNQFRRIFENGQGNCR